MKLLSVSLALAMIQLVSQVAIIFAVPNSVANTPIVAFSLLPLVVFGVSLGIQVRLIKRQQVTEELR